MCVSMALLVQELSGHLKSTLMGSPFCLCNAYEIMGFGETWPREGPYIDNPILKLHYFHKYCSYVK